MTMPGTPSRPTTCRLVLLPSGHRGEVPAGLSLLEAARRVGVELESICGGRQTCGKCQVEAEEGDFLKYDMRSSDRHLVDSGGCEEAYRRTHGLAPGRRLACALQVEGDLVVSVPPESQAHKQVISKGATSRVIPVRPAVRKVYVEVDEARLEDSRGDWERLQAALEDQWGVGVLEIDLVALRQLQPALREGRRHVTITLWQEREVLRVQPGYAEELYGVAADIGSTTVAAHLCDLRTGELLATAAAMNPQMRFGEDLMSRVSYGMVEPEGVRRMQEEIVRGLDGLIQEACRSARRSPEDILDLVLVGNTVMHHLFLGIDPVELGGAPFALAAGSPLDLKARDLGLASPNRAARVHLLPCIAGHVGADNVAVLLAEGPHRQDETSLIVDIGTNAEILLGNRRGVSSASTPTGPAFEGAHIRHGQRAAPGAVERVRIDPDSGEPRFKVIGHPRWLDNTTGTDVSITGICGSGVIEAVAELLLAGLLRPDGSFDQEAARRFPRLRFEGRTGEYVLVDSGLSSLGRDMVITQNDVRAIQLAKAALFAGIRLLMKRSGIEAVDRVVLAGAFGSYVNPWHAMALGLIPDLDLKKVFSVGNAAGDGARTALLDRESRLEAARLAREIDYVEIAVAPDFQEEFVAAMALPHAREAFPRVRRRLPAREAADPPDERNRRRRSRGETL